MMKTINSNHQSESLDGSKILTTQGPLLHFNFHSLDWLAALDKILPLPTAILIAFTPAQLANLGGVSLVATVFQAWKRDRPHWKTVYLHLDHATELTICIQAIKAGFHSVMFDGSELSFEQNQRLTQNLVALAQPHQVAVEAELGRLSSTNYQLTDPMQVKSFYQTTQVNWLAIAIGNYHGYHIQPAQLDFALANQIQHHYPAGRFVLHGASGLALPVLQKLVKTGLIWKINFDTDLQRVYGKAWNTLPTWQGYAAHAQLAVQAVMQLIHNLSWKLALSTKHNYAKTTNRH